MSLADFKRKMQIGTKVRGSYFVKPNDEVRTVSKVQSNGVWLKGSKETRFMEFPKSNHCEFDGKILKIYEAGYRALTEEEKQVIAEWNEIASTEEYQKRAEIDILTDGSSTYWQWRGFFERKDMLHLITNTPSKTLDQRKYRDGEELCVRDNKAPHGNQIAQYEIMEEA